jgi:hypothetical protein
MRVTPGQDNKKSSGGSTGPENYYSCRNFFIFALTAIKTAAGTVPGHQIPP